MPGDQLEPADHQPCCAEDDAERRARQFGPRWYAVKSLMDGLQLFLAACKYTILDMPECYPKLVNN
jgi:hypothetical protein